MKISKEVLTSSVLDALKGLQKRGVLEIQVNRALGVKEDEEGRQAVTITPKATENMYNTLDFDYNLSEGERNIIMNYPKIIDRIVIYVRANLQAEIRELQLKYTLRDFINRLMKKYGKEQVYSDMLFIEGFNFDRNIAKSFTVKGLYSFLQRLDEIYDKDYTPSESTLLFLDKGQGSENFIDAYNIKNQNLFDPTLLLSDNEVRFYYLDRKITSLPSEEFNQRKNEEYSEILRYLVTYGFTDKGSNNLYRLIEKKLKRLNTRSSNMPRGSDLILISGGEKIPIYDSTSRAYELRYNYNSLIFDIIADLVEEVLPSSGFSQSRFVYVMNNYKNKMEMFPQEREEKAIINRFINMAIQREVKEMGSFYDAKQSKVRGNYFEKLLKANPLPEIPTDYSDMEDTLNFWAEGGGGELPQDFYDRLIKYVEDLVEDSPMELPINSVQVSSRTDTSFEIVIFYSVFIGGSTRNQSYRIRFYVFNDKVRIVSETQDESLQEHVAMYDKVIEDERPLSHLTFIVKSIFGRESPALSVPVAGDRAVRNSESKSIGYWIGGIQNMLDNPGTEEGEMVDYNPVKYNPLTGTIKGGALISLDNKGLVYFPVDTTALTFYNYSTRGVCYFKIDTSLEYNVENNYYDVSTLRVVFTVRGPTCIHNAGAGGGHWTGDVQSQGLFMVRARNSPNLDSDRRRQLEQMNVVLPNFSHNFARSNELRFFYKHPKAVFVLAKATGIKLEDFKVSNSVVSKTVSVEKVLEEFDKLQRSQFQHTYSKLPDNAYLTPLLRDYLESLKEIHSDVSRDREYFEPNDGPWGFEDDERDWQEFEEIENREVNRDTRRRNIDE